MHKHANEPRLAPAFDRPNANFALPAPILAIIYGDGEEPDAALARLADRLLGCGTGVVGIVQRNSAVPGRSRCNMEVEILPGGELVMISEDRGDGARGCKLDAGLLLGALEQASAKLDAGADLLILNRFGKLEASGSGGRALMAAAVGQSVPVLVAVPWRNIDAFRAFAGDLALEMTIAAFETWAQSFSLTKRLVAPIRASGQIHEIVCTNLAAAPDLRKSEVAMLFDDALAQITVNASLLNSENVTVAAAAGRVLAEPMHARNAAPRYAVAAMDGYAILENATSAATQLQVIGEAFAGAGFIGVVGEGEAVRIFTGAAMPTGTDRCIMQEYARRDGDRVSFDAGYGPGWHVRGAGSDFAAGALLLSAGTRLGPRAMVAAAAADVAMIKVARRPLVAVIGTGDELAAPGSAHERADAIPESVTFGVAAMAEAAGAQVVSRRLGADCLTTLEALAADALAQADVIVVTGGASVGDRDFAKPMFAPSGLDLIFSKVAIKPGQPVWLGRSLDKWVLGLPGNPTSAMVTARLFLRPLLARLQGQAVDDVLRWRRMPLSGGLPKTGSRETFVRARWDDDGLVPLDNQQSGAQAALVEADWLIRCPAGQAAFKAGDIVTALAF